MTLVELHRTLMQEERLTEDEAIDKMAEILNVSPAEAGMMLNIENGKLPNGDVVEIGEDGIIPAILEG